VAVKDIAARCELLLVVGSPNSSNSVRLVEVARDAGTPSAYLVENAAAIDQAWLRGVTTVGLSSGASVPEVLVDEALAWLAERGFADVEEVTSAEEHLVFALPQEIRRDLRAASAAPVS
jgi:4-hydroxy-3-methylbut-2-enyl diphosphate reductase